MRKKPSREISEEDRKFRNEFQKELNARTNGKWKVTFEGLHMKFKLKTEKYKGFVLIERRVFKSLHTYDNKLRVIINEFGYKLKREGR